MLHAKPLNMSWVKTNWVLCCILIGVIALTAMNMQQARTIDNQRETIRQLYREGYATNSKPILPLVHEN
jgi:hypothetical protein